MLELKLETEKQFGRPCVSRWPLRIAYAATSVQEQQRAHVQATCGVRAGVGCPVSRAGGHATQSPARRAPTDIWNSDSTTVLSHHWQQQGTVRSPTSKMDGSAC